MNQRTAECLAVIVFSLNSLLSCDTFKTIELTDTAIPVSLILKLKESNLPVYGERNDVTPSPNDLACWLFLLFIFPACFFQSRICLWEMFIDFDASCRDKPLSTFCPITCKYMSFSCSVNLLLFFVLPLHPSSCSCASKSSSFSACSLLSLSWSPMMTAHFHHHPQILELLRSVHCLVVVVICAHRQPLILELLWSAHCLVLHSMLVCHCFPSVFLVSLSSSLTMTASTSSCSHLCSLSTTDS